MHLSSLFTTAIGVLVSLAAANQCEGHKENAGYCTTLTYEDITVNNKKPPSTAQCEEACHGVTTDYGDWYVTWKNQPPGYVQRMVQGSCSFSVGRPAGDNSSQALFMMDNQDIIDIIDEVNSRFGAAHRGRVSAKGTMTCQGQLATWYVD